MRRVKKYQWCFGFYIERMACAMRLGLGEEAGDGYHCVIKGELLIIFQSYKNNLVLGVSSATLRGDTNDGYMTSYVGRSLIGESTQLKSNTV